MSPLELRGPSLSWLRTRVCSYQPSGAKHHGRAWGARGGTGVSPKSRHRDLGHRRGWGQELWWVCRHGDRWSPRCRQLHRDPGPATRPHGHVDSSSGTKGPFCATVILPRASRGCLLCCFEDGSAPTQLMGFCPPRAAARVRRGWCRPQSPAALCSLPGPAGAAGRPRSDRSEPGTGAPLPRGSRGCGTARAAAQPRLRSASPGFGAHETETPRRLPPPRLRCPCCVGRRSVTFERQGPAG